MDRGKIASTLQNYFGYSGFRPHQAEIIENILAGNDVFTVMPTGGGKSICYQIPAILLDGVAIVVSPLISLMQDQVAAAVANGIRAVCLNSSMSMGEIQNTLRLVRGGRIDLLYVAPERFAVQTFIDILNKIKVAFIAIDEAHCVSEWGHDFRPDYLYLRHLREWLKQRPTVAAFTATATMRVQEDIIQRLNLQSPFTIRSSFNRPNIFYRVTPKGDEERQILNYVQKNLTKSGIIYRTTRRDVEKTSLYLQKNGIKAVAYHAGLLSNVREHNQRLFSCDDVTVVVATVAFGMGIDKSNVRYVVHGDIPRNMEGWSQETGRAGRDGSPAEALLLYSPNDTKKVRFILNKRESYFKELLGILQEVKELNELEGQVESLSGQLSAEDDKYRIRELNDLISELQRVLAKEDLGSAKERISGSLRQVYTSFDNLEVMDKFASSCNCRRTAMLNYFGEDVDYDNCGSCDICVERSEDVEATVEGQKILSALIRSEQKFGAEHLIDIVLGVETPAIITAQHNKLPTFGIGKDRDRVFWQRLVTELRSREAVHLSEEDSEALMITNVGFEYLHGREKLTLTIYHKADKKSRKKVFDSDYDSMKKYPRYSNYDDDYDYELFELLRTLRKKLADQDRVPAFVIFSDRTLQSMCRKYPTNSYEFTNIDGVSKTKLRKFGRAFLDLIAQYVEDNPDVLEN